MERITTVSLLDSLSTPIGVKTAEADGDRHRIIVYVNGRRRTDATDHTHVLQRAARILERLDGVECTKIDLREHRVLVAGRVSVEELGLALIERGHNVTDVTNRSNR